MNSPLSAAARLSPRGIPASIRHQPKRLSSLPLQTVGRKKPSCAQGLLLPGRRNAGRGSLLHDTVIRLPRLSAGGAPCSPGSGCHAAQTPCISNCGGFEWDTMSHTGRFTAFGCSMSRHSPYTTFGCSLSRHSPYTTFGCSLSRHSPLSTSIDKHGSFV